MRSEIDPKLSGDRDGQAELTRMTGVPRDALIGGGSLGIEQRCCKEELASGSTSFLSGPSAVNSTKFLTRLSSASSSARFDRIASGTSE